MEQKESRSVPHAYGGQRPIGDGHGDQTPSSKLEITVQLWGSAGVGEAGHVRTLRPPPPARLVS